MKVIFKTNLREVLENLFKINGAEIYEIRKTALRPTNYDFDGIGARSPLFEREMKITDSQQLCFDAGYSIKDGFAEAAFWFTEDGMVIQTAWSQFTYTFHDYVYKHFSDQYILCTYDGAYNGFLKQNLLPEIPIIEILSVEDSKGNKYDSLEQYASKRVPEMA
jgi:hypothetical protein